MPYKEREPHKIFYTIGEVAEMFGVNTSLIRFWEKEFDMLAPRKNNKGNRLFIPEDIETLRLIHHLVRERGFTLKGAKDQLKKNKAETLNTFEIAKSLGKLKDFLTEIKKEL